ncbi:hypothetical protein ZWY2020_036747 [Hordeum vulgare]|nr:hypothetical protein ZWY2020_036747 [Hordeum vulgare]
MASKWVHPEVYPLFAATGVAIGICAFSLLHNITGNPEVRVSKMGRAAGVLENHEEGRRYAEHGLRAYVQDKTSEIMPRINKFFAMYELFAMYREWQEEMAKEISGRQVGTKFV